MNVLIFIGAVKNMPNEVVVRLGDELGLQERLRRRRARRTRARPRASFYSSKFPAADDDAAGSCSIFRGSRRLRR